MTTQSGGMGNINAAQVTQYLEGVTFPRRKQDLVRHAQQRGAPQGVSNALDRMPDQEYKNMAEVMQAFGQIQ